MYKNGGKNAPSIGRRRGTSRRKGSAEMILNQRSILVLAALCATIFAIGLILGTHVFGTPDAADTSSETAGGHKKAEASPLAAATNKIASSDIQNLILASAEAEVIEKKEHELEEEALQHGDKKLAAHLRGALAPGDANYNPHHHVDDAFDDATEKGGDGALYAEDHGDHGEVADGQDHSMHNQLVDALKHEMEQVKKGKDHLVDLERKAVDTIKSKAKKAVQGLRGHLEEEHQKVMEGLHGHSEEEHEKVMQGLHGHSEEERVESSAAGDEGGDDGESSTYPYMTSPVSADHDFKSWEPPGGHRFVEYVNGDSPYAITAHLREQSDELARSRRKHVKGAMEHIWKAYKEKAFGKDELHPISGRATSNWGGMGTTLVDSLSTLWLMGMKVEFWECRDWVRDHLTNDNVGSVSGFETTIRSLGGLLSAYDLSHDEAFLKHADDLGGRLVKAYDTPSGLPHGSVNLRNGASNNFGWNQNNYILAEVGTQQIEYRYLARVTNKPDYAKKSEKVFDILNKMQPKDGLMFQNIREGNGNPSFANAKVSFGAMGDSVYEYMIKVWVQGGKKEPMYRDMWDKAMNGMHDQLVQKSKPNGLTYIADRNNGRLDHKMDHLVCFMGGALALGAYTDPKGLDSERAQRDLKTAKALAYTCYQMYARTKTGIAPEFVQFRGGDDMSVPSGAPFYILRPETVESFYYLSVLTGDPVYREWGWEVFQSIEKYCKVKYGYGSLKHVERTDSVEDRMESFFMAETLKYLYLLFDPDSEIDILNKHVFNTEAHPLKIFED